MISRRALLASTAAAAAASQFELGAATPEKAKFHLGVASYSFRKFSRAQAIQMTKELGVTWIDIKDFHLPLNSTPDEIRAARKEFEDAGLYIEGGGNISFPKPDEADIRHKFEYAKLAGFPLIVCAPTHESLPVVEKFVKEYNIKIAIHNHGPEDHNFPTPQSALEAVKHMDPRCGLCVDIGHTARTGADIIESIQMAGPRLFSMHFKDLADTSSRESQVAVGDGKLPIRGIFAQLIEMGYSGGAMLEYEIHPDDPMPGMQKSFAFMRGVLVGMQAV